MEMTLENLLKTALLPIGNTMYIYGGGWNEEDTGAGIEAMTIGVSHKWAEFAIKQDSSYNFKDYDYKQNKDYIHLGLDCSGYIGWLLYNIFQDKGYVDFSRKIANNLATENKGKVKKAKYITEYKAGDIMSGENISHVWLSLGQCFDGSVVILHSSPAGVHISGTPTPKGAENSQAIKLANKYMGKYYPVWNKKYPVKPFDYLGKYSQFRWYDNVLYDKYDLKNMCADMVLERIFEGK